MRMCRLRKCHDPIGLYVKACFFLSGKDLKSSTHHSIYAYQLDLLARIINEQTLSGLIDIIATKSTQ